MTRYSLKTAIAATRGARTTAARAERRYARDEATSFLLRHALAELNRAERRLLQALVLVGRSRAERRAA